LRDGEGGIMMFFPGHSMGLATASFLTAVNNPVHNILNTFFSLLLVFDQFIERTWKTTADARKSARIQR
jgi:hypothetical protein